MKKILSLLLCLILSMSCFTVFGAAPVIKTVKISEELTRMIGLEIIRADQIETWDEEKIVTRADLSCVLTRFLNMEELAYSLSGDCPFEDIKSDFWATGYISLCKKIGVFGNIQTDSFLPNRAVTVEETVNMLIYVLGYPETTQEKSKSNSVYLELLRGVEANTQKTLKWGTLVELLDNALGIELVSLISISKSDLTWGIGGETAFEAYFPNYFEVKGVVQAIGKSSIYGEGVEKNEILINNRIYDIGNVKADEFLGKNIIAFGKEVNDNYFLTAIYENPSRNKTLLIDGSDIKSVQGRSVVCSGGKKYPKNIMLADYVDVVYNGAASTEAELKNLVGSSATVTLIDNNTDNKYDVAIINLCEYALVKNINLNLDVIYFEETVLNGINNIIIDEDDADETVLLFDEFGEKCDINSIQVGNILSVCRSRDGVFTTIRVLEKIEIIPDQISDESVYSDGVEYIIKKGLSDYENLMKKIQLGIECTLCIDKDGYVVYVVEEDLNSDFVYGYIYDMYYNRRNSNPLEIEILTGTHGNVKKNDDSSYTLEGTSAQELVIYEVNSKVRLNNVSQTAKSVYEKLNIGDIIRFTTDESGVIKKIYSAQESRGMGDRNLNCKSQVFGGITEGAFGFDENTFMFFVPKSGDPDDIGAKISLDSGDSYKVQGFDMRDKEYIVNAVVVSTDMKLYETIEFGKNAPLSIVYDKKYVRDENDEFPCKLYGYTNGVEFESITDAERSDVNVTAELIKPGDIIHMAYDFNGKITQMLKIASIKPGGNYYHIGKNSSSEKIFASLIQAEEKYLGAYDTEYKNRLLLSTGYGADIDLSIKYEDGPSLYIYDSEKKIILPCTFDEIASLNYSEVFVYLQSSVAKIVVAVR